MLALTWLLQTRLDALLAVPDLDGAIVCATVADDQGRILYDHNGGLRVSPASNEKLFSAAFALWELGPDYRPTTSFWKLPDRIVVQSGGDPSMSHDELRKVGESIDPDGSLPVYANETYAPEIPGGWEMGDLPNRYAGPVAAFSVDQSGFEIWDRGGRPHLEPESYGVTIRPAPGTGPSLSYDPIARVVSAGGPFPKTDRRLDTLAVPSADGAAASLLGKWKGRTDQVPSDPPTLTLQGQPLSQIISTCLHRSDNNMAENLLLMGAEHEGALSAEPYRVALRRLKEFETRVVGIGPLDTSPRDGSGLTRANLATTHAIVKLLAWADAQPTAQLWRSSLASPSTGTLSHRLNGLKFFGKTGTLSSVTALSGYLQASNGRNLIVSVIVNGYSCSEAQAVAAVDGFYRFVSEDVP